MFFIKVIDKILNKIKEFYLMRVCIKFGGNLIASEWDFEWRDLNGFL